MTYSVKDWAANFETDETRKRKALAWVPIPNKQDGLGFKRLASQRDRCELFAAWVLILQIASKGKREERGILARDGQPLDAETLSLMTGFPQPVFDRALTFFSDPKQGWLVGTQPETPAEPAAPDGNTGDAPGITAQSAGAPACSAATSASSALEGRKEEKEVNACAHTRASLPESLDTPAMRTAWDNWLVHWSTSFASGRPMPEQTAHAQLRELVLLGPERAIAAITNSITKGGLRKPLEPYQQQKGNHANNRTTSSRSFSQQNDYSGVTSKL